MKERVQFAGTFLLVVFLLVAFASAPAAADAGAAIVYTWDGPVVAALTWGCPLTETVRVDGLGATDGRYGLALSVPLSTVTDPLAKACGFKWSAAFQAIAHNTATGPAALTEKAAWREVEFGWLVRWTAVTF